MRDSRAESERVWINRRCKRLTNQENEKTRVYEYAKSLNMSSKEIITILKRLDIPVNNHMSVMENETVQAVEKFFRDIKANAAAKRAAAEAVSIQAAKQQSSGGQQALKTNRPVSSQAQGSTPASTNQVRSESASSHSTTGASSSSTTTSSSQNSRVYPPSSNPQQNRPQGQGTGSNPPSRPNQGAQRPGQPTNRGPASSGPRPGATAGQQSRPPYPSR